MRRLIVLLRVDFYPAAFFSAKIHFHLLSLICAYRLGWTKGKRCQRENKWLFSMISKKSEYFWRGLRVDWDGRESENNGIEVSSNFWFIYLFVWQLSLFSCHFFLLCFLLSHMYISGPFHAKSHKFASRPFRFFSFLANF